MTQVRLIYGGIRSAASSPSAHQIQMTRVLSSLSHAAKADRVYSFLGRSLCRRFHFSLKAGNVDVGDCGFNGSLQVAGGSADGTAQKTRAPFATGLAPHG